MKTLVTLIVSRPWTSLGAALLALGLVGAGIAAAGLVPVKASSGHWAITERVLQFGKRRSVATYARLATPSTPTDLDDERRIRRGAGHFETGCRFCHGAPGAEVPPVPRAMTPTPPRLSERAPAWSPRELFHIVRHGVKFTGMPAWPVAGRDDEVWDVVAFLRRLPSLDAEAYERLVFDRAGPDPARLVEADARERASGDTGVTPAASGGAPATEVPEVVRNTCARCHGLSGLGRDGAFPVLAGQHADYMARALEAYASLRRHSGVMAPVASRMSPVEQRATVAYYAALPGPSTAQEAETTDIRRGRQIASSGVPARDVPSCEDCHDQAADAVNRAYPRLAGQHADYLERQLQLMQARRRGGSDLVVLMHAFVDRLTADDIRAVAAHFASSGTSLAARRAHDQAGTQQSPEP